MEEAGFANLLRTILILILIYYAIKFVARLLFPMLFKKVMRNVEKKFQEQQHQRGYTESQNVKEGETVIDKAPQNQRASKNTTGEYIDYEEVE